MIDAPSKYYFRQRQRNKLYETVIDAVEGAASVDKIRRCDIAARIDETPSQVSHFLKGPANWTIDKVSDVLYAAGGELDFVFVKFDDRQKGNRYHHLNDESPKNKNVPAPVNSTTSGASTAPKVEVVRKSQ